MSETATITFEIFGYNPDNQAYNQGLYGAGGYGGYDWNDFSEYVLDDRPLSLKYGMSGLSPSKRIASPGMLDLVLDNEEFDFSIGHDSQHPAFKYGASARLGLHYGALSKYWLGRITKITPSSGKYGGRSTIVRCKDWIGDARRMKVSGLDVQTAQKGNQLMTTLLASAFREPRTTDFETGISTFPYAFDDVRDDLTNVLAIIDTITRSELGWCAQVCDSVGGGTLKWWSRYGRINETSELIELTDDGSEETDHDLLLADLDEPVVQNLLTGTSFPRVEGDSDEVLWSLSEAITIAAGATQIIKANFRDPNNQDARLSAIGVMEPDSDTWTFSTAFSNWTIVSEIGGNQARFEITNDGATGTLDAAQLKGQPLRAYEPVISEDRNEASITDLGELTLDLRFQYQDDANVVDSFLDLIMDAVSNTKQLRAKSVRISPNRSSELMTAFISGEPGNKLLVNEAAFGFDSHPVFLDAVSFTIQNRKITCDWTISNAGLYAQGFFRLDISQMDVGQLAP